MTAERVVLCGWRKLVEPESVDKVLSTLKPGIPRRAVPQGHHTDQQLA
jgi:hypothetical protein